MTATMEQAAVAELAEGAAAALTEVLGVGVSATFPAAASRADCDGESVAMRSELTVGGATAGLVTVVPAFGLTVGGTEIDSPQLVATIVNGAAKGMTQLGAAGVHVAKPQPTTATEFPGSPYEFDLTVGTETVTILWVVEASLGALMTGGDPVDPPVAEGPSVAPATFPELTPTAASGQARELQLLADVPMNVTVEVGRGSLQVRELLSLVQGSIVELDRVVGSPVDVMVNGTLIAHGDIVLVGDDLGVRITEIVEPV
jgi:flagellar motor switch protein FliN/FliY